ncbi:ABC transporter ATP-binding protein [Zwartia sp.]|uniref:ABC transporter ATP-binding protein n=1 Tax=Zwartia sp. TaxID=2978004 RepID=UPI00271B3737|nr:ABC transporter ATP-binding protein [Zwartia sp.]MDO9023989.1 ABC transporter ATP-binding protein [Zwartia sp.]
MNTSPQKSNSALHVQIEQSSPMPLHGSFQCEAGELMALVGPSGAGKTSMLRAIAGLLKPTQGKVTIGEQVWMDTENSQFIAPQHRHVGLVFQDYALMPHLSALENVALSLLHLPSLQRKLKAKYWLDHVHLSEEQQLRRPNGLSGGQQQRVAVARALAREPRVLLLDEPFSAVDQMSRQGLYDLLADLRKELNIPIVLVTHDLVEARHLADSLVVMESGTILQQGTPAHIYRSPRNARVADLVGVQNRFLGCWLGPQTEQDIAEQVGWLQWCSALGLPSDIKLRIRDKGRLTAGQNVTWVIQGEGIHVADQTHALIPSVSNGMVAIESSVRSVRNLGETTLTTVSIEFLEGVTLRFMRSGPQRQHLSVNQVVTVMLDCAWVHVMPVK